MRAYHVAIVGSGPSGFFAASALLRAAETARAASPDAPAIFVDMLEMLPTPWGLVRSGVAPDHPRIKSISRQFEKTAADPAFRFFGNVSVGSARIGGACGADSKLGPTHDSVGEHVSAEELARQYDAVIYAIGAQNDRPLNIPGEDLPGSLAAVRLVGWYNAHPHFTDLAPDLSGSRAVVVGNGNVAIDVARMLVSDTAELAGTDIADHALAALADSGVEEVLIVGRRGPMQATFTTHELHELADMASMADVDVIVDPADLADVSESDAAAAGHHIKLNIDVLRGFADTPPRGRNRRIVFRFFTSPIEIRGRDRVESIVLGRNELVTGDDGRPVAVDTGAREEVPASLVVRAVGYRGAPTDGLPFDSARGIIPNVDGRVVGSANEYVVGWIKRGPSGVIGHNKKDSAEVADLLIEDLAGRDPVSSSPERGAELEAWLRSRQPALVTTDGWLLLDAQERAAGEPHGRPRVKLPRIEALLRAAGVPG